MAKKNLQTARVTVMELGGKALSMFREARTIGAEFDEDLLELSDELFRLLREDLAVRSRGGNDDDEADEPSYSDDEDEDEDEAPEPETQQERRERRRVR